MLASNAPSLQGIQLLVIDDDQDSRDLLLFVLQTAGADVIAVNSVEAAKTSFVAQPPQLVISDLAMPEFTGYDFLQWVRSRSAAAGGQVPVLALTAMASPLDRQQALAAGFTEHLSKPADLDELIVLLERFLQPRLLKQEETAQL